MLQSIEEERLVGGDTKHAEDSQPEQVAAVSDPATSNRRVKQEEHHGGSEHPKTHQSPWREMRQYESAGYGQAGKEELDYYEGEMNQQMP
jgi:hypothetical protein